MGTAARLRAGSRAHARALLRNPLHVLFLVVLPPVVIEVYGLAMASFPTLPFMEALPATLGRINGAVFAAAFLAGLVGLFQVISARQADDRLQICGFRRWELFLTRLSTILAVGLLAAGSAFAILAWRVQVAAPALAFAVLVLAGLVYGLLGALVGVLVPSELEGSLLLVFLADFDVFLASGLTTIDSPVRVLFPMHFPYQLFRSAVRDGSVGTGDLLATLAYIAVVGLLVLVAYVRLSGGERA